MSRSGSLNKCTRNFFNGLMDSSYVMSSLFGHILKTYPYNKNYNIQTQKDDLLSIIRCRILSSEFVLNTLAELFELNFYECKPFLREAAVFIFHDMTNCENNVKTGISYLLYCKSRFEYLRDVEIRILDPYHNE